MAVVVDDFDQGITEIVRGIDLLDSTPRQIHLQRQLGFTTPDYMHIPVAMNEVGQKLSKLTGALAISEENPGSQLVSALRCLDQNPPDELAEAGTATIWCWVAENWKADCLRGKTAIPATQHGYG